MDIFEKELKKNLVILDCDMIFIDVCYAEFNTCDTPGFLDLNPIHKGNNDELVDNCGIYSAAASEYFSKLDYSKFSGVAEDFDRIISLLKLKFMTDDTSILVISKVPSSANAITNSRKMEFIKKSLVKADIHEDQFEVLFTFDGDRKGPFLNELLTDHTVKAIVEDNCNEIQSYLDHGYTECEFFAPTRLPWATTLRDKFQSKISFYS